MKPIAEILDDFAEGRLDRDQAAAAIDGAYFEDLGHSTIDHDRLRRTGSAEVVYGEHKTPEQVAATFKAIVARGHNAWPHASTKRLRGRRSPQSQKPPTMRKRAC